MPGLHTSMHIDMLENAKTRGQPERDGLYGLQWGDPETMPELQHIRDHWLLPYVRPDAVAVEIGPGGGRWTRYLLGFRRIYAVDYHHELLAELRKNFPQEHIVDIKNNGTDFPSIVDRSIDFVFSFGAVVHMDVDIIAAYLENMKRIVKPDGNIVIHYSDKDKEAARNDRIGFSENNPRIMRAVVEAAGYDILEEDTTTLRHSSMIRFRPIPAARPGWGGVFGSLARRVRRLLPGGGA